MSIIIRFDAALLSTPQNYFEVNINERPVVIPFSLTTEDFL